MVLIGAGFGYAYNSVASPDVMGHSIGELGLPSCLDGQVLEKNSSGWGCADLPSPVAPVAPVVSVGCRLCTSLVEIGLLMLDGCKNYVELQG